MPRARFGAAVGLNSLFVAAAATVGPTLAGAILSVASWHWLFAINLPLGVAAVAIGLVSLPATERARRRFDWQSALLSALAIGLLIVTIDGIGHGAPWPQLVVQLAIAAVAGAVLYRRELGIREPLLPLDLLRLPVFSLSIATSVASFVGQMVAFVSLPFMLQSIYGFSPIETGLLIMPWPLATAVTAPLSGYLSDRYSPALLCGVALVVFAVGLGLLASLPAHPSAIDIGWRMALSGAGFGFFQSPNNRTLLMAAPRARSAAASGMLSMARLSGQALGAALVALILGLLGLSGATTALYVGAAAAILAAVVSISRIGMFESGRQGR